MLAHSSIRVEQTGTDFLTNTERPMVQSAPYVVNAAIDYENQHRTQARLLYNVTGPRLVEVGTDGIEDAYQHPQHLVDLTASQGLGEHCRLSATLQNLLNTEVLVTQGERDTGRNVRVRYREGITASLGLSYTH
jgi:outer membrane receptor protein involved in Fe transport